MNKSMVGGVIAFITVLLLWNSFFIIAQTQKAVMLQFGRIINDDVKPGLHIKIPFVNQVRVFDGRLMTLDSPTQRLTTQEKKSVMVDAYAKWRVSDPSRFYTATSGSKQIADDRITQRLSAALSNQFGRRTLHEVVSGERDGLMKDITSSLNAMSEKELGIEVLDVRVISIELPKEVYASVYERMRSEREREAREHRAMGEELAERVRANADRQKRVLEAEAHRQAEELRGEGAAKAATIYASAYGKDPKFYSFYRSLQVYKNSFDSRDVLVLNPNMPIFNYLDLPNGLSRDASSQ